MENPNKIFNGALSDNPDSFGFQAGDIGLNEKQFPQIEREVQAFEQEKYPETRAACTIVNGIRQRGQQMGIHFADEEFIKIVKWVSDNQGYTIGKGWDSGLAMNALNKYFALFYPDYPCYYARVYITDPIFPVILSRGYTLGMTYQGNSKRNSDRADGLLEGKAYIPPTYGHRTCLINKNGISVDDSYPIKQYEIQYFKNLVAGQIVEGKKGVNIYPTFYVWVSEPKAKEKTALIKRFYRRKNWLQQNIANNESMMSDTIDPKFLEDCAIENRRLQFKLDYINNEL